jgi:hypothetical protein
MRKGFWVKGVVGVAVCLLAVSSVLADAVSSRKNSSYGEAENPQNYDAVASLSDLIQSNVIGSDSLVATETGTGFEVFCEASLGCPSSPTSGAELGWLVELTAPTPGSSITITFGADTINYQPTFNDIVNFMECDPSFTVNGLPCMNASTIPGSTCAYSETPIGLNTAAGTATGVTINLPSNASCIPSTLIFTDDEFVPADGSPTFGAFVTAPEPSTFLLMACGLLALPLIRRLQVS